MPRRDRGPGFTAVTWAALVLILCLVGAFIFDLGLRDGKAIEHNEAHADQHSSNAQKQISQCVGLPDPVAETECIRIIIADSTESQRAEADLVAQTEMSLWAKGALIVSAISLSVTALGVWFVRQTLGQNREAIALNRMATDAAVSGNERALRAISQEQANAERAMQAYVSAESAIAAYDGSLSAFIIEFSNSGTTPALWINTHASFDIIDPQVDIPPFKIDKISTGNYWPAIAGGRSIALRILAGDDAAQAITAVQEAQGRKTLRVFGRVRYQTVFNDVVESEFAFHTSSPRIAIDQTDEAKMMKSNVKIAAYEVIEKRTNRQHG